MTAPLLPPQVDLRDFAFMPLEVARLRKSKAWLRAKRNPALAFYELNLWTAAWHEVPAGSIEDDDDVLADLAMCDPLKWLKVKADVMRAWVTCDDGRLYHPTVCEKALQAWESKLDQRWRTERARIKKHNDRHAMSLALPTFEEWTSQGCPSGQRLPVPRDTTGTPLGQSGETLSKGEGEGQREGERQGKGEGQGDSNPATAIAVVPATPGGEAGPKKARAAKEPAVGAAAWIAYATAFLDRYGVEPVRNASVNAHLATLVAKVGADDAPMVAAFYVSHNKAFYVSQTHSVAYLAKDAEGLRAQWASGRRVMSKDAQEADRVASDGGMWGRVAAARRIEEVS